MLTLIVTIIMSKYLVRKILEIFISRYESDDWYKEKMDYIQEVVSVHTLRLFGYQTLVNLNVYLYLPKVKEITNFEIANLF